MGRRRKDVVPDETEYEVKEISKRRTRKGVHQYLIHWEGFSAEEATWEPRENIKPESKVNQFDTIFEILQRSRMRRARAEAIKKRRDRQEKWEKTQMLGHQANRAKPKKPKPPPRLPRRNRFNELFMQRLQEIRAYNAQQGQQQALIAQQQLDAQQRQALGMNPQQPGADPQQMEALRRQALEEVRAIQIQDQLYARRMAAMGGGAPRPNNESQIGGWNYQQGPPCPQLPNENFVAFGEPRRQEPALQQQPRRLENYYGAGQPEGQEPAQQPAPIRNVYNFGLEPPKEEPPREFGMAPNVMNQNQGLWGGSIGQGPQVRCDQVEEQQLEFDELMRRGQERIRTEREQRGECKPVPGSGIRPPQPGAQPAQLLQARVQHLQLQAKQQQVAFQFGAQQQQAVPQPGTQLIGLRPQVQNLQYNQINPNFPLGSIQNPIYNIFQLGPNPYQLNWQQNNPQGQTEIQRRPISFGDPPGVPANSMAPLSNASAENSLGPPRISFSNGLVASFGSGPEHFQPPDHQYQQALNNGPSPPNPQLQYPPQYPFGEVAMRNPAPAVQRLFQPDHVVPRQKRQAQEPELFDQIGFGNQGVEPLRGVLIPVPGFCQIDVGNKNGEVDSNEEDLEEDERNEIERSNARPLHQPRVRLAQLPENDEDDGS